MLFYTLKEVFSAMKRAALTSIAATATLTICLFLLGLFLMAYVNVNRLAGGVRARIQIEAFLGDDVDQRGAQTLADKILTFPVVKSVTYVNKEMALEAFRQEFGDQALQVLTTNPLPTSLLIELHEESRSFTEAKETAHQINDLPGVMDVEYGHQWLSKLESLLATVGTVTVALGIILATSSVLVVATTIRLTFQVRKEAVEIMRLVGASSSFIARPLMVEGAVYGFLGGVLGIILLGLLYAVLSTRLTGLTFLPPGLLLALLITGILLGAVGSTIPLRETKR